VRSELLAAVASMVPAGDRVRVAVDGRDGAGKTVFADELASVLRGAGRPVVRASVDGFHRPRAARYARGRTAQTYWRDAFDYAGLVDALLLPFAAGAPVRTAVHDVRTDTVLSLPPVLPPAGAVLVVDGVFLHRDELVAYWDFSVYLQVDLAVSLDRLAVRDGTPDPDPRYLGAQRIYAACDPAGRAAVVVDNTDLAAPRVKTARG
jgi:uridine kinase